MSKKTPPKEELIQVINSTDNIHAVAKYYNVNWSTVRCWLRWSNINLRPNRECLILDCCELTDIEIGRKHKISDRTVAKWKKEYGISKRQIKIDSIPKQLTEEHKNIITGTLLGDAYIVKVVPGKKQSKNSRFGTEHCLKDLEYVNGLHSMLCPFSLPIRYRERKNPLRRKSWHCKTTKSCLFETVTSPIFTELRNKWYPNDTKIVPRDLQLNWQTIAVWFCDDGCNQLGNRCVRRDGVICTQGFSYEDVEFLVNSLNTIDIKSRIGSDRGKPIIKLSKDSFDYFIEQIQPYITWKCMERKILKRK